VIQAGEAILEVGDPSALEVVIDVLSFDATKLKPGLDTRLSPVSARRRARGISAAITHRHRPGFCNLVFLEHSRYPIPPTAFHLLLRAGPVWILAFALHNAAVTQPQAPQLSRRVTLPRLLRHQQ